MTHTFYVPARYLKWAVLWLAGKEFRGAYKHGSDCFAVVVEG